MQSNKLAPFCQRCLNLLVLSVKKSLQIRHAPPNTVTVTAEPRAAELGGKGNDDHRPRAAMTGTRETGDGEPSAQKYCAEYGDTVLQLNAVLYYYCVL